MDAIDLLDRISIKSKVDYFAKLWCNKKEDPQLKTAAFAELLEAIDKVRMPAPTINMLPMHRQALDEVKRHQHPASLASTYRADRQLVDDAGIAADTPEAIAAAFKLSNDLVAADTPAEVRMAEAIKTFITPGWNQGQRQFLLPEQLHGRPLPSSQKRWDLAFRSAGLQFNKLEWTYDQKTWRGPAVNPENPSLSIPVTFT